MQVLDVLRCRALIDFSLIAVNVDSGYEQYKHHEISLACQSCGWEYRIEHTQIGEVMDDVLDINATPCSLCAKLRRGGLYRIATNVGARKIALGHHSEDVIETLRLNFEAEHAGIKNPMLKALANVAPRHLLDTRLNLPGNLRARAIGEIRTVS